MFIICSIFCHSSLPHVSNVLSTTSDSLLRLVSAKLNEFAKLEGPHLLLKVRTQQHREVARPCHTLGSNSGRAQRLTQAVALGALLHQVADTAGGIRGPCQPRGMCVSDPSNFESHLFQCHLPIGKHRMSMLTKMRFQVAPWVVRAALAATKTELATLAKFLATMRAWHGDILRRQL